MQVGDAAYAQLKSDRIKALDESKETNNVFVEFKRTMGSDETYTPDISPEIAHSSEDQVQ